MALSALDDESKKPDERAVAKVLGRAFARWAQLQERLGLTPKWGFTSRSTGWGLRLAKGDRIAVYLTPCEGYFLASFALGGKAVAAARTAGLGARTLAAIDAAKKYAEGYGVRFPVKTAADARDVERLVAVKLAH